MTAKITSSLPSTSRFQSRTIAARNAANGMITARMLVILWARVMPIEARSQPARALVRCGAVRASCLVAFLQDARSRDRGAAAPRAAGRGGGDHRRDPRRGAGVRAG